MFCWDLPRSTRPIHIASSPSTTVTGTCSCQEMAPTLPHELVDYILEFLWDDIRTLFNCSLTCHRYRGSPMCRHFRGIKPTNIIYIHNRRDLDFVSRVLSSKRTRRFYEQDNITYIAIGDNPHKPFAHTVPLRISPSHLPDLDVIEIFSTDWVACRPHPSFFLRLAHFVSVTRLGLYHCRFHFALELRQLTDALPNLTTLHLIDMTCDQVAIRMQPSHCRHRQTLKELYIPSISVDAYGSALLGICASYSTVTQLHVYAQCFHSFGHFQTFIRSFPFLTKLSVSSEPNRSPKYLMPVDGTHISRQSSKAMLPPFSLTSCNAYGLSPAFAEQMFAWLAGSLSISILESFTMHPAEDPTSACGHTIGQLLEKARNTLKTIHITLHIPGNKYLFAASLLETLNITIYVYEDTRAFDITLHTVTCILSSITSRHLQNVNLHLVFDFDDFSQRQADAIVTKFAPVSPLSSIISRDGPVFAVVLTIGWDDDVMGPILDAAIDIIPRFFASWDERGALDVIIPRMYRINADQAVGHPVTGSTYA
ncbi:hypothetical protein DAEQUDRAFT_810969 [Daedalea quercina L-15889]|uniref:F-box domain-containing protein n=1 Tax=Daedalea quercina L-15889 TaxID=1314783 RepID=A0A165QUK9_9APHY|nr:hypothetical protein DAEQUDRAFT_810969 [Daedalea quercina L-15889]